MCDWDAEREQVENMRSMCVAACGNQPLHAVEQMQPRERCPRRFVAMAGDWRVVVVKLADRSATRRLI